MVWISANDLCDQKVIVFVTSHVAISLGETEPAIVTSWLQCHRPLEKTDGIVPSPLASRHTSGDALKLSIVWKGPPCEVCLYTCLFEVFGNTKKMIRLREMQFPSVGVDAA